MNLKAVKGRVLVSLDTESKNWHTFISTGQKIRLERNYNNLNFREVNPVNATVIEDGYYIPKGSQILIHHQSCHPVNKIFNYTSLSGNEAASTVKYFSIPESECYLYIEPNTTEWKPCNGFATALRIFKLYKGIIEGIEPSVIPNILFITSGKLKNKACHVLKSCDYELVFQGIDGVEQRIIRLRHFDTEQEQEREEIICINHSMTKQIENGELLVGLTPSKAQPINDLVCQN